MAAGMVLTLGTTGHLAQFALGSGKSIKLVASADTAASHAAAATRLLSSPRAAAAALTLGCIGSAAAYYWSGQWEAAERAPVYAAITVAAYASSARLLVHAPARIKLMFPPTICTVFALGAIGALSPEPLEVVATITKELAVRL